MGNLQLHKKKKIIRFKFRIARKKSEMQDLNSQLQEKL